MSTIEGIPESITREQYLDLFRSLNIDPAEVLSLRFAWNGIQAEVFATDDHGLRIMNAFSKEPGYAKHSLFIRVDKPTINFGKAA